MDSEPVRDTEPATDPEPATAALPVSDAPPQETASGATGADTSAGTPTTGTSAEASAATASAVGATAAGSSAAGASAVGASAAGASAGEAGGARTPRGGNDARREPENEPDSDTGALLLRPSEQEVRRRALEREHAVAAKPALARFLQVVVAVIFPIVVLAGAVRAVTSSFFLWVEYHRPGFPADEFGFSTQDRLTYGSYALDYVLNFAPARYLGGLVNPGGQQLFLDSEVSHMADVKAVLQLSFAAAFVLLLIAIAACAYLARRYKGGIRRALFSGAVLTLVLIVVLAVSAVLAWEVFFTSVHAVFFADGTWTFRVDDTLIRLFPEQFWTDAAATVGFLVLAATLLTLVLTWPTRRRRERSQAAQDELQARHRAALSGS
ncbi:TIGR01906 family membrane protein [Arthrobacter zhaoguopingii]|uniref:TIGR01906 family membrane protein n=1 Tax=Arthrobacter zhaoguopingii TaxID=2681491 RepID=UPI001FE33AF5|nr:TIGR01906 family membrane protein [Arthrobacter zhaoguopingii]